MCPVGGRRGVAIAAHLELVGGLVVVQRAPVFHHVPPAEMAEARLAGAAVVLVMLRFGQAAAEEPPVRIAEMAEARFAGAAVVLVMFRCGEDEAEDPPVRMDAMAGKAGELVYCRLCDV